VKNIGHGRGVLKFMQWYSNNQSDVRLEKLDASQLAAFGLGWYISDSLTRDEKKQWQRQIDHGYPSISLIIYEKELTVVVSIGFA
jgi:hypothetical protein